MDYPIKITVIQHSWTTAPRVYNGHITQAKVRAYLIMLDPAHFGDGVTVRFSHVDVWSDLGETEYQWVATWRNRRWEVEAKI